MKEKNCYALGSEKETEEQSLRSSYSNHRPSTTYQRAWAEGYQSKLGQDAYR